MIPDILESIQSRLKKIFYLDLRMLACFRIGLGIVTLWDLLSRARSFKAHYGMSGVLSFNEATLYADFNALIPLHLWFTSDILQTCLFLAHGLAALALMLGIKTRWATIICWLLINSLHARNPLIIYGADRQLAALFFWSMFIPMGAKWSLDAKQRVQWKGKDSAEGWFCAGFILQVALIYFTSAWSKSGETWTDGSAVWLALNINTYTSDLGRRLLDYPSLLRVLTYSTLIAEWLTPLIIVGVPNAFLRKIACWILISLQVGFLLFMDLGLFPIVSILALIAILPSPKTQPPEKLRNDRTLNTPAWDLAGMGFVALMVIWQTVLIRHEFSSNAAMAKMPGPLQWVLKTTRLAQSWSMFSPDPPDRDGWFILEYKEKGIEDSIDLLSLASPVIWEKSPKQSSILNSDRWKEWFNKVYARGLNWEQTIRFLHLEQNPIIPESAKETEIQLQLWFLEESAHDPLAHPKRHLLYEQSNVTGISERR